MDGMGNIKWSLCGRWQSPYSGPDLRQKTGTFLCRWGSSLPGFNQTSLQKAGDEARKPGIGSLNITDHNRHVCPRRFWEHFNNASCFNFVSSCFSFSMGGIVIALLPAFCFPLERNDVYPATFIKFHRTCKLLDPTETYDPDESLELELEVEASSWPWWWWSPIQGYFQSIRGGNREVWGDLWQNSGFRQVLSDPQKRQIYDAYGEAGLVSTELSMVKEYSKRRSIKYQEITSLDSWVFFTSLQFTTTSWPSANHFLCWHHAWFYILHHFWYATWLLALNALNLLQACALKADSIQAQSYHDPSLQGWKVLGLMQALSKFWVLEATLPLEKSSKHWALEVVHRVWTPLIYSVAGIVCQLLSAVIQTL